MGSHSNGKQPFTFSLKSIIITLMKTTLGSAATQLRFSAPGSVEDLTERAYRRLLSFLSSIDTASTVSVEQRLNTIGGGKLRAGSYVPLLIAEPFGTIDQFQEEEIVLASLCLDIFSRTVDSVTDNEQLDHPLMVHIGSLCLGKAAQIYANLIPRADGFWKRWEHYLNQASEAERFLWRHRGKVTAFGDIDFKMLGQKSALIQMSAAAYASLTNRWEPLEVVERGLLNTATGIQIVDDLLDLEEDVESNIYSFPLVYSIQNCIPGQSMIQAINSPSSILSILNSATTNLEAGRRDFAQVRAYSMASLVAELLNNLSEVKRVLHELPNLKPNSELILTKHVYRIINPRLGH